MQPAQPIYMLWDASHIWGLMAWRALRALGLSCRLVKGQEIAEGALLGKPGSCRAYESAVPPPLLVVPGGNARLKALALGEAGRAAVRAYLEQGGGYLGFCGGAGLALSHRDPRDGLQLCPWSRAAYPQRLHHLISGHVRVRARAGEELSPPGIPPLLPAGAAGSRNNAPLSLPVWWPGRFAPENTEEVCVLAAYDAPDADFWLADLPLQRIPAHVFEAWQALYGINLSADFLTDQPLVVSGAYGQGRYVLSYSHLETPQSPDANAWLAHLLRRLAALEPRRDLVPGWELGIEIAPDARRNGFAREALAAVVETYFAQTETVLFTGGHYAYNTASGELLKKLGFVYEGVEHKAMHHAERGPTDLVCYYLEKE